jgi:hypothetical protein
MNSSLKEKALLAVLGMVLLYAAAAASWFLYAEGAWRKSAQRYAKAKADYEKERRIISERGRWAAAYEEEKSHIPTFEAGKATDTTWLKKMDDMALKHRILISQRQSGREVDAGEVLEQPIEVKSWEGSLEALVKFMYELENSDEGMFDIKELNMKPSSKKGYLRGSFTLTCAYMRE